MNRASGAGKGKGKQNQSANAASTGSTPSTLTSTPSIPSPSSTNTSASSSKTEYAGNASASDPSSPLQIHADFRINTDTGATSHMTPHRHWLRDYKLHRVPVRLANGTVVYSEGVGSMRFQHVLNGVEGQVVEFFSMFLCFVPIYLLFSTSPDLTTGVLSLTVRPLHS